MNSYQAKKMAELLDWLDEHGYSTTVKALEDGQKKVQFSVFIGIEKQEKM